MKKLKGWRRRRPVNANQHRVSREKEVKSHIVLGNTLVMTGMVVGGLAGIISSQMGSGLALFLGAPIALVLALIGALLVVHSANTQQLVAERLE